MTRSELASFSDLELGWLAGLLEGEGSFLAIKDRGKRRPAISLAMVDKDVVERAASLLNIRAHPEPPQRAGCQATVKLFVTGWPAVDIMLAVKPLMGARRRAKIEELVALQEGVYRKGGDLCQRGLHRMTGDNVYVSPSTGHRLCRSCRRTRRRRARLYLP